uniref:Exocyst complex component 6B n=1 Tax=Angiostrongylus cantonensis TaxID=6313 RepID=A0A0K0D5Z7_ANGCA
MDGSSVASTKDTAGESSDTASTSYQPAPDMSAEQEFFLYELETTDSGSIGLVLRAIYDCGDVRKFSRALEHRIHQYDRNIQKSDATYIDAQIQAASEDLSKKSEEIVKYRYTSARSSLLLLNQQIYRKLVKNASTAIDQISVCLPVLENYAKLQELMQLKKYYQALKVLEELEHTHLALVEKYRFTQILAKTMSPVRSEIKARVQFLFDRLFPDCVYLQCIRFQAYSEFKDFLENIKKVACRVGRHASRCVRGIFSGYTNYITAEQHSFGATEAERSRRLQQEAKQYVAFPFKSSVYLVAHIYNSSSRCFRT